MQALRTARIKDKRSDLGQKGTHDQAWIPGGTELKTAFDIGSEKHKMKYKIYPNNCMAQFFLCDECNNYHVFVKCVDDEYLSN